jgi:hypothetical protein
MPIATIAKLEEAITSFGRSPSDGGALFVELCALLLNAMGFTNIYKRKGAEAGRDIDAKLAGQTWYFECKRYSRHIDTPQTAYKFLQLDILPERLQPDFFILMSNASMKSILKDIVEFKRADLNVKYSAESWVNEPLNPTFDTILLSYPEVYINFLIQSIKCKGKAFDRLVADFRSRSDLYLRENPTFFADLLNSIAVIKKARLPKPVQSAAFALQQTYELTKRIFIEGWSLVLIGCPLTPVAGLYDFYDFQTFSALCKNLSRWGLLLPERRDDCIVFHEIGTKTAFFNFGSIVTVTRLSYSHGVEPWEWLIPLREDCFRMRNFSKKGFLITPATFKAYIVDLGVSSRMRALEKPGFLGTMDRFLPRVAPIDSKRGFVQIPPSGISSDELTVTDPPNMHDEIGRPLVLSLWKNAGLKNSFFQCAEVTETQLLAELRRLESIRSAQAKKEYSSTFNYSVEFFRSLNWLREGELLDTSYEGFEMMLKAEHKKRK